MLLTLFKVIGGSLLAAGLIWALVLGWWQSNDHQPGRVELALYLGALPLALIGGFWLLRGFIEHLKAPPAERLAEQQAPLDTDPLARQASANDAAERRYSLEIIDAYAMAGGGRGIDDMLAALADGKRPSPDAALQDADGFPVFAAALEDLDSEALLEEFAGEPVLEPLTQRGDVMRAVTLLDEILVKAGDALAALVDKRPPGLSLHVLWQIPADWDEAWLAPLHAWLLSRGWPAEWRDGLTCVQQRASSEADALRQLDRVIVEANVPGTTERLILIVGAVSMIDQIRVDAWERSGLLFSAKRQDRCIPGEGAVALLLATTACCDRLGLNERLRLSRVGLGERDKSVQAGGRISGQLIQELAAGLLGVSATPADKVAAAVVDTDHRALHFSELLEGLAPQFGHLEPIEDCLSLGTCNGSLPPVGALVALACAGEIARTRDASVICVSNQHGRERAVLLVAPSKSAADAEARNT